MTDSTYGMISMTYDMHCETFRFAWRKIRFVFPLFGLGRGQNEMKGKASCLKERCPASRLRRRSGIDQGLRRLSPWSVLRGRFATPQNEVFGRRAKRAKELRKSAANRLKSLAYVNLCAD